MKEDVLVAQVVPFVGVLDYHVAAYCHQQWVDALADYLLHVGSLDQGGEQLDQLQSHSLDAIRLFDFIVLVRLVSAHALLGFLLLFGLGHAVVSRI